MSKALDYQSIVTAILLASSEPLTEKQILLLFDERERPSNGQLKTILQDIGTNFATQLLTLQHSAAGWRLILNATWAPWIARLEEQKPARYSNALLETLAFIAYRQPVTRTEIEEARGVSLSPTILRTLLERQWVRLQGHREAPGRPALFVTTTTFLADFNLKSLRDLPVIAVADDLPMNITETLESSEVAKPIATEIDILSVAEFTENETSVATFEQINADFEKTTETVTSNFADLAARLKSRQLVDSTMANQTSSDSE